MKRKIIFINLMVLGYFGILAQPLSELIQEIPNTNLSLKVQEKEYYAALEKVNQINPRPDPEIGLGIFPLPVETRLGRQVVRISAMQFFPWFGTVDRQQEVASAKASVQQQKSSITQLEVKYQLEQAYYRLYEIEKSRAIIQRNKILLEALEQLALAKVESGSAIAADVLRVQLQKEKLVQQLAILATHIQPPTITINQLLNRPLAQSIRIQDSLTVAQLPVDKEALLEQIAKHHPLLAMYERQQEVAQKVIDLNGLSTKPTFGVGLDYIFVNERIGPDPVGDGRDILQLKAVVRLPLYQGKYESKEREELLNIETLELQKTDALSRFRAQIEKAYAAHEAAAIEVNLYDKQIALTKAAIRILETAYSTNGTNFDELLQLERELIEYDLKILNAVVQSHMARSSIERFSIF